MTSCTATLPPSRPSLLDGLAHAALARACAAFRQADAAGQGLPPLLVDATLGNGHDAAFLLSCAPPEALLLGVDIQPGAVSAATERLAAARQARPDCQVQIFCRGHQDLPQIWAGLPPSLQQRPLLAGIFNLGWLPGGDKSCLTQAGTTLAALDFLLERLMPQGCLSVHCYTGNQGGPEEEAAVLRRAAALPPRRWRVVHCRDANREAAGGRAESLVLMERLPVSRRERLGTGLPSSGSMGQDGRQVQNFF